MKKIYLNIFFQFIAIIIIIRLFFYENYELEKLSFLLSKNIIYLFALIIFSKLFLTYLFYHLLKIVTSKKNSFHKISNYFLQGGMVNQLLPGIGFLFKYYKFNEELNINISEFSSAQFLWSFFNFGAFIFLAIIFGYASINFSFVFLFIFFPLTLLIFFIVYFFRQKIYFNLKKYLLSIKKISGLVDQLKIVKDNLIQNTYLVLAIFCGFIFFALLQCFNFYIGLRIFGSDISFIYSNYVYISSSLASIITMFSFIGWFELIVHFSSTLIVPNIKNILLFAFAYRLISIICTFIVIVFFSAWGIIESILNKAKY